MLFSSPIFLFAFLPLVLLFYYLLPLRFKNTLLLLFSLIFYAWGEAAYVVIMLFSILFNYGIGMGFDPKKKASFNKYLLALGVVVNLALLGSFKYLAFITESLNSLVIPVLGEGLPEARFHLPIGISFFTFQAISYLVDVYRQQVEVQKNPLRLGLYIALFPQLIAGPIVRYRDINQQLHFRSHTLDKFYCGFQRFAIGLGKKVLIANSMAYLADEVFSFAPSELSFLPAWLGIIAYSLQIYFDFSGYSDMAIGLGSMFGFKIKENFNFPYTARSLREFWRRWHISLSTWFRDYLYIPLGGNRGSAWRTSLNLLLVFFLTGLWHGASFNFIVWGLFHGVFLMLERGRWGEFLVRHRAISHVYTLLVVVVAWVFFRAENLPYALGYLKAMFLPELAPSGTALSLFLMDWEKWLLLILGLFFSTFLFTKKLLPVVKNNLNQPVFYSLRSLGLLAIFGLSVLYLTSGTYNPFIYFRF